MSRIPEPKCRHKRKGIVRSGEYMKDEPYASTQVCDRSACIEDAIEWANRTTLSRTAEYISDADRKARAS